MEESKLDYLCIYSPDLGSDDNINEQLLFVYNFEQVDNDVNLRRIGLAQGVVVFGKDFSENETVSTLETTQSRIVIEEIEENIWVVLCAKFAKVPDNDGFEFNSREVSTSEILSRELVRAYRRWRMHYGTINGFLQNSGRDELVSNLSKWWTAWCEYWSVELSDEGVVGLWDAIRYSKGELSESNKTIVKNTLEKQSDVVDMVITRFDELPENRGCIWAGNKFTSESIDDLVRWVLDCEECEDEAFTDTTGFIYNYKIAQEDVEEEPESNEWAQSMNATMDHLIKGMKSMSHLSNFSNFSNFSSVWNNNSPVPEQPQNEDLAESKFLVGLRNTEDINGETENITTKQVRLQTEITKEYKQYNLVIYRRRPFTFTLIYEKDDKILNNVSHYNSLHLRLASLVEPLSLDLFEQNAQLNTKFYYIVHDSNKHHIRSSLPCIPTLPQNIQGSSAEEQKVMERIELVHVHQAIAALVKEGHGKLGGKENERFQRTSRNWWVYWCRVNENREAVLARKWTKNSTTGNKNSTANNNALLGVLGNRDAKMWLDNYKHYDRV